MARRILGKASGAPAGQFSADDIDYINAYLTGTDQGGTDPAVINTITTFKNNKLKLRDSGDTHSYTIATTDIAADRTLTVPLLTGNDNFLVTGAGLSTGQTITNSTIDFSNNTLTGVASTTTTQTLTSKTMDANSNTFQNVALYPDKKLWGFYAPGLTNDRSGDGIMTGTVTLPTGSTGAVTTDSAGKYMRWTGAATIDNYSGVRFSTNSSIIRAKECRFKCRFRLMPTGATTNTRFFCGLSTANTNLTGDTGLNSGVNFMLAYRTTDTNYMLIHNDNSATAVYDDVIGVAKDSNVIHTFEIKAPAGDTGFQWSFDGGAFSSTVTTQVPLTTSGLLPHFYIQTSDGVAKITDMWYIIIEMNP